jgi:hypothetical protein
LLVRLSLPYFIILHAYVYIAALLYRYSINSVLHFPITTIRERTARAILQEARESAIKFNVEKTELLYASRKREIPAEPI